MTYASRLQRTRRREETSLRESEREGEGEEREIYFVIRGGVAWGGWQLWGFGMRVVAVFTLDLNQIYVAPGAPSTPRGCARIRIQDETHSYFFSLLFSLRPRVRPHAPDVARDATRHFLRHGRGYDLGRGTRRGRGGRRGHACTSDCEIVVGEA